MFLVDLLPGLAILGLVRDIKVHDAGLGLLCHWCRYDAGWNVKIECEKAEHKREKEQ